MIRVRVSYPNPLPTLTLTLTLTLSSDRCDFWVHIECDGISQRGYDWVQTKDRLEYVCPGCAGRAPGEFGAQLERRLPPPPKPQLCRAPGDDEWLPPPSANGVAPQLFDALQAMGERPGAVGEQGGGGGGEAKGGGGGGGGGEANSKRRRCGSCPGCRSADCGTCGHCLSMKKFGGDGSLRKPCERRKCTNLQPSLPKPQPSHQPPPQPHPSLQMQMQPQMQPQQMQMQPQQMQMQMQMLMQMQMQMQM